MLASKAAYLASLIPGAESAGILEKAAQHDHAVVRVAAAAGLHNLPGADAARLVQRSLLDSDAGVRKSSLNVIETAKLSSMKPDVERLAAADPELFLREHAQRTLGLIK